MLLVLCTALGVWLLLGEPATQTSHEVGTRSAYVFPFFKAQEIVRIELLRGSERVVLRRPTRGFDTQRSNMPTAGWKLLEPLEDRADDAEVNRLLNGIQYLRIGSRISPAERAEYRFGQPLGKLVFYRDGKAPFALTVGAPRPGAVVPVRDERDGSIYQVKDALREHLERPLWMLRDKQLTSIRREDIASVSLEIRGGVGPGDPVRELRLVLQEGRWRVGGPRGEHAARSVVDEVLAAVGYVKAVGIAKDDPSPAELREFGLNPPLLRIAFSTAGEAQQAILDVGRQVAGKPQRRYLRVPRRPLTVYEGEGAKFLPLLQRPPEDYLDPALVPLEGGESTISELRATFDDGAELHLRREDKDWQFVAAGPPQPARTREVDALLEQLLSLTVLERHGKEARPEWSLDDPELRVQLRQGKAWIRLDVGAASDETPGAHYVRLRDGDAHFIYLADLRDVPLRLRDGPLELRHRRVLGISHHDIYGLRLLDEAGKTTFSAERKDPSEGKDPNPLPKWTVAGESGGTDHQRVVTFLKRFEDLRVERWVALDTPAARREYGLAPSPRRLVFEVRTIDASGELVDEERVLLLGQRVGERVHVLYEAGQPAIGLVDASFLDRIGLGFGAKTELFSFRWYEVVELEVYAGDELRARFRKTDKNWLRDGRTVLSDPADFEDRCLKPFDEGVGVGRTETASAERLAERGLRPPAWKLVFRVRTESGDGEPRTCELWVGNSAGLGDASRWATAPGEERLGAWYDGPLRSLQGYLREHPGSE
ncbi:MAG: DUF4340 domain-containing protein [Planctomycetota bacterium]|nr:MAG: DUF4340 domain-containing protein [Planctomycetota bacterium]